MTSHKQTLRVLSRDQVLAFRLDGHNLARRLPPGSLLPATRACGVQNTPPGSALSNATLALHARVAELTPAEVDRALEIDKTLLQVWSMRASPHVFPTGDAAVFTLGLLPEDEESLRFFIRGASPALDLVGISATEVIERTAAALPDVLDGHDLTKDQLGIEIAKRVAQHLPSQQLAGWQSPSWYAPDQRLGETIVRFALSIVALQGLLCFAPRQGRAATFIRTDRWLGSPLPNVSREQARAELVRRYLRCYGPSTAEHFAEWAGIAPTQATQSWRLVEHELIEVDFEGRRTWLHESDLPRLASPATPEEIHFLPPHEPYLQLRDRATLVPDKALQRHLWRSSGNPGIVLVDGCFVATWRPRKTGQRLRLVVEMFTPVSQKMRSQIEMEAATLAPYRRCRAVEVEFR
jgi:hypothetical protein